MADISHVNVDGVVYHIMYERTESGVFKVPGEVLPCTCHDLALHQQMLGIVISSTSAREDELRQGQKSPERQTMSAHS
jgi:hypothetical protein